MGWNLVENSCIMFISGTGLNPAPALRSASTIQPQMLLTDALCTSEALLDVPGLLLAKSGNDEILEEVFINTPIVVTGLLLGIFVFQYVKNSKWLVAGADFLAEVPFPLEAFFVPLFAFAIFFLGKIGVLGTAGGLGAKALLDGWNVFANVALPGAILKY